MSKAKAVRPGYGKILDAWVAPEGAGDAIGCIATSFTFSPAFFEEECVGRFLQLETDPVEDGPAYIIEREEKLSQLVCAAALVDQHHSRGVRSLRWDLLAVRLPQGILHAKISLLLWSARARLIIASANLTEDGYRRNQEVFGVLDYFEGSEAPRPVLDEVVAFLLDAMAVGRDKRSPEYRRCGDFLNRVTARTRQWGAVEAPRSLTQPRIFAVLSGPGRKSVLATLKEQWPDGTPPHMAFVISPFFDPPDAANEPAKQIWNLLRQRGEAYVEYNVTAEEVPGEKALLVHAPKSILDARPQSRSQTETRVHPLKIEDGRPLHAKCLWFESDRLILSMLGSSNFTSPGLGVGRVQNLEANLAFLVGTQTSEAKKALLYAWLPTEEVPDGIEVRWQPQDDAGEDSPNDTPLLPNAFAEATFGFDMGHYVEFSFSTKPPAGWALYAEDESDAFATEEEWIKAARAKVWRIPCPGSRAPSGCRVTWKGLVGFAWWPVNILSQASLPPPDELKDLPLEILIEILTSAKPLQLTIARWLRHKRAQREAGDAAEALAIDPHKRVDTSAFLLQRTRRVSWALTALRERLERPVVSEPALEWRLRGPVGVQALANAIGREARTEAEKCFLLTELCLELGRVRPQEASGSLSKQKVKAGLRQIVVDIRAGIDPLALTQHPELAQYAKAVFEKVAP
jgi:hypothetical protein